MLIYKFYQLKIIFILYIKELAYFSENSCVVNFTNTGATVCKVLIPFWHSHILYGVALVGDKNAKQSLYCVGKLALM